MYCPPTSYEILALLTKETPVKEKSDAIRKRMLTRSVVNKDLSESAQVTSQSGGRGGVTLLYLLRLIKTYKTITHNCKERMTYNIVYGCPVPVLEVTAVYMEVSWAGEKHILVSPEDSLDPFRSRSLLRAGADVFTSSPSLPRAGVTNGLTTDGETAFSFPCFPVDVATVPVETCRGFLSIDGCSPRTFLLMSPPKERERGCFLLGPTGVCWSGLVGVPGVCLAS